ncbi:MAG: class I SAM-dependent methyltransferase [Coriobacteriaceae bacterium]|jgi:SAM-dependent methyltransferase|nr:class I SAM-dependent methyltransferase [Olsenella sp.]MCI1289783.1 class I SAM-dependent methyltransferase [Olsenella sp.]RRF89358.1 MAG: class I SAM-dependent methyltransferase [Coriobacteriaceae bacterium]
MQEAGHTFLARLGKTKLRPGGIDATEWLIGQANIGPDTKVLEVACNMGTTMVMLAQRYGCSVTGIDLDERALDKARANIGKNRLEDSLTVVHGSAFELPFEDQSFDIVINEAMLTMLPGKNKDRALAEYARILKPGGLLLTQDVCFRTDDVDQQRELRRGLSRAINVSVEPLDREGWKSRIESHGFVTEQKSGDMTLLDPQGMVHDEGTDGALKIMFNAMKQENFEMFTRMFRFFNGHKDDLGYVANFSCRTAGATA